MDPKAKDLRIHNVQVKATLIFFLLAFSLLTRGQKKDNTDCIFQVVYAENVKNSKGESLKSLDCLPMTDVLTITGYLLMTHQYGFPVEYRGDTVIRILDIHTQLKKLTETKPGEQHYFKGQPNIALLFITNGAQARRNILSATGAVHDGPEILIVYPPSSIRGEILYKGDLCLTWMDWWNKPGSRYEVTLIDVFDEALSEKTQTDNSIRIEDRELRSLQQMVAKNKKSKNQKLLLKIAGVPPSKVVEVFYLVEFPDGPVEFPYPCTVQNAGHALIIGLSMEMSKHDDEAERYYQMATTLSDKEFFRTMLQNFKQRK